MAKNNPVYLEMEQDQWQEEHPGQAMPKELKDRVQKAGIPVKSTSKGDIKEVPEISSKDQSREQTLDLKPSNIDT